MEKERKETLKDMFADRKYIVSGQENLNVYIDEIFDKASKNEMIPATADKLGLCS